MTTLELQKILEKHKQWIDDEGGDRAVLQGADLNGFSLQGADLNGFSLQGADLIETGQGEKR